MVGERLLNLQILLRDFGLLPITDYYITQSGDVWNIWVTWKKRPELVALLETQKFSVLQTGYRNGRDQLRIVDNSA
jgi:hypothetical protein